MEALKEKITINKYPRQILAKALMEGDIIVPDTKPDAAEIIYFNPCGAITEVASSADKISFKGSLSLSVIYMPKGEEKRPEALRTDLSLKDCIDADLSEKSRLLCGGFDITDSILTVINDRKIHYRLDVALAFWVIDKEEAEIVKDVKDLAESFKVFRSYKTFSPVCAGEETFKISEELSLPDDRGEIGEIFDTRIMLRNIETKLSGEKLSITGDLSLKVLYRPSASEELEITEYELPISGAFETQSKNKNAVCRLSLSLISSQIKPADDHDGELRRLSCEFNLRASYIIMSEVIIPTLKDAYIPGRLTEDQRAALPLTAFVCRNKNQFPVKETVELDPSAPPILRVCGVICRPVCDRLEPSEGRITAEGMVEAKILYTAKDDARPLFCYETLLPYRQTVEMKGLCPSKSPHIDAELKLEHISFSTLDSREIELKPVLSLCITATESISSEVITDICFKDLPAEVLCSLPSMTLYIVKPEDTLWQIAKDHSSDASAILKTNKLSSAEDIKPGQRLLILKAG